MFYAWLGMALWGVGENKGSYHTLRKALTLGEDAGDIRVIGYACTWLVLACIELDLLDEGIEYGERAKVIAGQIPSDQYLYFKSRGVLGYLYYNRGEAGKALEAGKDMVDYGVEHSNIRSQAMGHAVIGWGYMAVGDQEAAIRSFQQVEEIAVDPFYSTVWSYFRGVSHFFIGQLHEAEAAFEVAEKCSKAGFDAFEILLQVPRGLMEITKGRMGKGMNTLLEARKVLKKVDWKCSSALLEHILGKVYLGIALREGGASLSTMIKNIGFLIRTYPTAARRAEAHFAKAIEIAGDIGAKGTLASAHLELGKLHKAKGRYEQAREHFSAAIEPFERCEADVFLKQSKEAFASLD
jgi:tetratricopeptide (TPR) repeat protein